MPIVDLVVTNKLGLHARAAAKLTQLAGRFQSEIFISRGAQRVNAKSIMGVMMLAAGLGVTVRIDARGTDEEQAINDIRALFDQKFGESE
ncbi:MAG TPA: HPr family phosphocarrier protein [Castellaniella sp.]|uniref:HPr family phosphocarrier protein n=1 Tax=Castellaniella sp. TaxID=1955812 RepID=UPI002EEBF22E